MAPKVNLHKRQNAKFDHFGVMNMMKAGGSTTINFDDLTFDGQSQDFAQDPNWYGWGNRASYQARDVGGAHNFGFSDTRHAGGQPGEAGGVFWRTDHWGYYADKVGPLSFNDRLEARGKVVLVAGVSRDLVEKGVSAGNWVRDVAPIVGGGGGGKADLAQAGGKQPEKLPEALAKAKEVARAMLGA